MTENICIENLHRPSISPTHRRRTREARTMRRMRRGTRRKTRRRMRTGRRTRRRMRTRSIGTKRGGMQENLPIHYLKWQKYLGKSYKFPYIRHECHFKLRKSLGSC